MEPWIQTFTGVQFWFLEPSMESISITDIAHSLSMQCRYGGHCQYFYSVAEHSVLTSHLLEDSPTDIQLWGLLHDAAEAYLSDVPSPIKKVIPELEQIEHRILEVIVTKFGLNMPMPAVVKQADRNMLYIEEPYILSVTPKGPLHATVPVDFWTQSESKELFLRRFNELTSGRFQEDM